MYQPSAEMEPIFFKYIVPLACTEKLRVPPAHQWNKNKDFPDNVILTDNKGNRWPVKLEKIDNYVCFVGGWLDFVKDNNVEVGDFVVFENIGPNEYSVLLLDPNTACEKQLGFMFEEQHSGGAFEDQTTEEFEHVDVKEEDISTEEEEGDVDDDDDVQEEEQYSEDEDEAEDEDDDFDLEEESKSSRRKSLLVPGASNRPTDIYGNAIFKSRGIPLPNNPYFLTYRRPKRNDELYVPLHVIKDYNLNLPKKTIMRDRGNGKWETELNVWSDNRHWYCGGWSNFWRKHHVDYGEACICEFVKEAGKGLILLLYKLPE